MIFSVHVQGDTKQWSFDFEADPAHWQDWLDDGLEVYRKIGEQKIGKGMQEWIESLDDFNKSDVENYIENGDDEDDPR